MANIRLDLTTAPTDGMTVNFKAPCDCADISGLILYYPNDSGSTVSNTYTIRDAHGNNLEATNNLFMEGAYLSAILNTVNHYAFIKNTDTNAYLEGRVDAITLDSLGAAAENHTHTPESIGAAGKSVALTAPMPVASWDGGAKTLTVSLSQDITGKNLVVSPAPASFEAWCEAGVRANEQRSDGLGFTCTEIPTVDLTANILIIG